LPSHTFVILGAKVIVDTEQLILENFNFSIETGTGELQLIDLDLDLWLPSSESLFCDYSLLVNFFDGIKHLIEELHASIFIFFKEDVFEHDYLLMQLMNSKLKAYELCPISRLLGKDWVHQVAHYFPHLAFELEYLQLVVVHGWRKRSCSCSLRSSIKCPSPDLPCRTWVLQSMLPLHRLVAPT
jgi:hypothetical protein